MDFVPGRPFSSDNYRSLTVDSVCTEDGFAKLGIKPQSMVATARQYWALTRTMHRLSHNRASAGRNKAIRPVAAPADMQRLRKPYLLFLGDVQDKLDGEDRLRAQGLVLWTTSWANGACRVAASRLGWRVSLPARPPRAAPVPSLSELRPTCVPLPCSAWVTELAAAARRGLDVVSGLHTRPDLLPRVGTSRVRRAVSGLIDVRAQRQNVWRRERPQTQRQAGLDCRDGLRPRQENTRPVALARNLQKARDRRLLSGNRSDRHMNFRRRHRHRCAHRRLHRGCRGTAIARQCCRSLGRDRGTGIAVSSRVCGRDSGSIARVAARTPSCYATTRPGVPSTSTRISDVPILQVAIDDYLRAGRLTNPAIRLCGLEHQFLEPLRCRLCRVFSAPDAELGLPGMRIPCVRGVDVCWPRRCSGS